MGKSVYMLPSSSKSFNRAQLRRMRDELGSSSLRPEGPFSDHRESVSEIADHVKSRVMRSFGPDMISATLYTLLPQNLMSDGHPHTEKSWLDIPFHLGKSESCWSNGRFSAGEIASAAPVACSGKPIRPASLEELTLLGVSVLRSLGIESYYSYYHFDTRIPKRIMKTIGANVDFSLPSMPSIIIVHAGVAKSARLIPKSSVHPLMALPPLHLEVLDEDAIVSMLKLHNARDSATMLMHDISKRTPEFENEGSIRAMQIGHTLFEGTLLWTLDSALENAEQAAQMFAKKGRKNKLFRSLREDLEKDYVHVLRCPNCHMSTASEVILCDGVKKEVKNINEDTDLPRLLKNIESIIGHKCISKFTSYFMFAMKMNEHIHPTSDCGDQNRKDAN